VEVTVKLYSTFSKYQDNLKDGKIDLEENSTILDLARRIGLPLKYVRLVFVNGEQRTKETRVSHRDVVHFHPPAIGGG